MNREVHPVFLLQLPKRAVAGTEDFAVRIHESLHFIVTQLFFPADRDIVLRGTVFAAVDLALCDGCAPFLQLLGQRAVEFIAVFDRKLQMVGRIGVGADSKAVQQDLNRGHQHRGKETDDEHAAATADRQTDARRGPEAGRRGQPFDRATVFEDDACAEKAYAGNDLRCYTRGIRGAGAIQDAAQILEAVFGDDHGQRRSDADDNVRTNAGLLKALAAFKADRGAADASKQQAQTEK